MRKQRSIVWGQLLQTWGHVASKSSEGLDGSASASQWATLPTLVLAEVGFGNDSAGCSCPGAGSTRGCSCAVKSSASLGM